MHEFRGGIRIGNSYFDAVNYSYLFARVCFAEKSLHFFHWTVRGRSFFRTCEEYSIPILKANYSNSRNVS